MNMDYVKNGMWYCSRALFVASAVLVVLTVTRVSGFMTSSGQITKTVKAAKAQNGHDEETVRNLLAKGRQAADQLKKKNMFVTPPPTPKPPVCLGIIGSSAIINGKQYKAGDNVGGAEIISVGTKEVVIKWQDNEMKLIPFAVNNPSPPSRKPSSSSTDKSKSESKEAHSRPSDQDNKQSKTKKDKSPKEKPKLKDDKFRKDKSKPKYDKPSGIKFPSPGDKKSQSKFRLKTDFQPKKSQNNKSKRPKKTADKAAGKK